MKTSVSSVAVFAPNWLGDAVMALPAIADVRRGLGDGASLVVVARPGVAPLFALAPGVDRVVALERRGTRPALPLDTAILLPNSFQTALAAWRAGIAERWGYRTDWRRPLLTRAVDPPREVHQVEYYRRLVAALGFENGPAEPRLPLPPEVRTVGERHLREIGWQGGAPLVVLAPGAAYGGAKRWPPAHFAELACALAADGVEVVMVGSQADLPVGRAVAAEAERLSGSRVAIGNLMGTDLAALAGILAHCRALVTNDSGAMHLAAALGVRVTAVFGPTDERLTRPSGAGHAVLVNPVWCRPCMMRECPIDHRCLRGIAAARVVDSVRQML
jgi:heptosyltransferase-2